MSYGEFWLLDVVVEHHIYMCTLGYSRAEAPDHFNRPWHGMTRDQLCRSLQDLLFRGYIYILREHAEPPDVVSYEEIVPSYEQIVAEVSTGVALPARRPQIMYGLTSSGGALWESLAHPDWSWYHNNLLGHHELHIEAASNNALGELLEMHAHRAHHYVLPDTERRAELIPWQATYWKQLPSGWALDVEWSWLEAEDYAERYLAPLSDADRQRLSSRLKAIFQKYGTLWYTRPCR